MTTKRAMRTQEDFSSHVCIVLYISQTPSSLIGYHSEGNVISEVFEAFVTFIDRQQKDVDNSPARIRTTVIVNANATTGKLAATRRRDNSVVIRHLINSD